MTPQARALSAAIAIGARDALGRVELAIIESGGSMVGAAERLGMHVGTLYRQLDKTAAGRGLRERCAMGRAGAAARARAALKRQQPADP